MVILVVGVFTKDIRAQNQYSISATRVFSDSEIAIDGKLTEPIWRSSEIATNFTQSVPYDGLAASERTEIRIVYSNKYMKTLANMEWQW